MITLRVVRGFWGRRLAGLPSPGMSGLLGTRLQEVRSLTLLLTCRAVHGFTSSSSGSLVWLQLPPLFWSGAWQPMPRHFRWAQGLREVGKFGDCFELVNSPSQEQFSFWRTGGCLQVAQQAAPAVFVPQLLFAGFFITTEPGSTFGLAFTFFAPTRPRFLSQSHWKEPRKRFKPERSSQHVAAKQVEYGSGYGQNGYALSTPVTLTIFDLVTRGVNDTSWLQAIEKPQQY